jgi:hypothetical protein
MYILAKFNSNCTITWANLPFQCIIFFPSQFLVLRKGRSDWGVILFSSLGVIGKSPYNQPLPTGYFFENHWIHPTLGAHLSFFLREEEVQNFIKKLHQNLGQQFDNIQHYKSNKEIINICEFCFLLKITQANLLAYPWAGRQAGNPTKLNTQKKTWITFLKG